MHWCQDETNALLATIGMAGPAVLWVKFKFRALRTWVTALFRRPTTELCQCGHDHETSSTPMVITDAAVSKTTT